MNQLSDQYWKIIKASVIHIWGRRANCAGKWPGIQLTCRVNVLHAYRQPVVAVLALCSLIGHNLNSRWKFPINLVSYRLVIPIATFQSAVLYPWKCFMTIQIQKSILKKVHGWYSTRFTFWLMGAVHANLYSVHSLLTHWSTQLSLIVRL